MSQKLTKMGVKIWPRNFWENFSLGTLENIIEHHHLMKNFTYITKVSPRWKTSTNSSTSSAYISKEMVATVF